MKRIATENIAYENDPEIGRVIDENAVIEIDHPNESGNDATKKNGKHYQYIFFPLTHDKHIKPIQLINNDVFYVVDPVHLIENVAAAAAETMTAAQSGRSVIGMTQVDPAAHRLRNGRMSAKPISKVKHPTNRK